MIECEERKEARQDVFRCGHTISICSNNQPISFISIPLFQETEQLEFLIPKRTSLKHRLPCGDLGFVEFVRCLLIVDPDKRPTASEALQHPWMSFPYKPINAQLDSCGPAPQSEMGQGNAVRLVLGDLKSLQVDALEKSMLNKINSCLVFDRLDLIVRPLDSQQGRVGMKCVPILAKIKFIEVLLFTHSAWWEIVTKICHYHDTCNIFSNFVL